MGITDFFIDAPGCFALLKTQIKLDSDARQELNREPREIRGRARRCNPALQLRVGPFACYRPTGSTGLQANRFEGNSFGHRAPLFEYEWEGR